MAIEMLKVRETNELLPAEHKKREDRGTGRSALRSSVLLWI